MSLQLTDTELGVLQQQLNGARVLGLGEPTHGTAEAFQWKWEVTLALAQAGMLRVVAWECGFATSRLLDAALRSGQGDLRKALEAQRFWTWNTQEILHGLEQLQAWNMARSIDERVRFVGVDVQEPYLGVRELIQTENVPEILTRLTEKGCVQAGSSEAEELLTVLNGLERQLTGEGRSLARNAARFVDTYLLEPEYKRLGLRDEFMARTLLEEALSDAGLTVFWAHNEHIAVNPDFFGDPSAGFVLHQKLGAAYKCIGMMMGSGVFRSRDLDAPERPKPLAELSVGEPVEFQADALFLNREAGLYVTNEVPHAGPRRYLGGQYGVQAAQKRPQDFQMARPNSDFDLIRWFPHTTTAKSLV